MTDKESEEQLILAISLSVALDERIERECPADIASDARTVGIAQLFVVMVQHHRSIRLLLADGGVDASARALLRPLIEAGYRAAYLKYVADPEECDRISRGDARFPKLNPNLAQLLTAASGRDFYGRHLSDIEILHDLTHSGSEQMSRHFSLEGGVRPNRDLAECAVIMNRAVGVTAAMLAELMPVLKKPGD